MAKLYTLLGLIKSGTSAGGKFDGPSVKKIILEENLQILSQMLPADKEPFMEFLRSCRELHSVSVRTEFKPEDAQFYLFSYKVNFQYLYENFGLNETLKTHVILAHFGWYFENTGTNFRNTNGEFVEAAHYSLKNHEIDHGYVVKKKQGTPHHLLKAFQSLSSFNSMRVGGTPPQEFTLRKPSTPSSTPKVSKKIWNFPTSLLSKYPLPEIDE